MRSMAGIILAAGMSKRMGTAKQLLRLNGRYLLQWVVNAAIDSTLEKIYLVLGCNSDRILISLPRLAQTPQIEILYNPNFENGMSSSVKCGLSAAKSRYESVMFLLGDQPFISSEMINQLQIEYQNSDKKICLPAFQGKKGNPVIFNSYFYKQLMNVTGDMGGRHIIRDHPEQVLHVPTNDPKELFDIDTKEDLARISKETRP